jgi:hypothetical protein
MIGLNQLLRMNGPQHFVLDLVDACLIFLSLIFVVEKFQFEVLA